jgi:signal transduction histidine kinase
VTRLAVDKIAEVLELPTARLWLYDDDRDALEPAASTEQSDDLVGRPPTYTAEGESLSWRVFATGRPFLSGDLTEESACHNPDTVIRSELVLPLGDHGVINVGSTEPNAFEGADVTLTKLWARTVTQVLDRLEQKRRLRGHHAELSRERDRLEEFGSVVSHDLRNPLNVVEGSLTLARETGDTEHFERAHAAVDRIDELVDDLLALARAGEDVTTTEPVALEPVVEQCWETVSTGEATLVVGVGDETTTVRADPSRLRQLFENLFRNSVEHASPGVEVTVGTLPGGFFVEDDGTGIPPEDRDRVQERGYTTSADGTGFGLSIVAEVAAAHGWEMRVTAGRTGGARFEFTDADTGA